MATSDERSNVPKTSNAMTNSSTQPHEPNYPRGWDLTFVMTGLCLGVFCVALDTTIIATALPRITDQFHDLQDVGWYGSAYILTTCAFQLMFGKLFSKFSIKKVYLVTLAIFELGSVVCGVAQNTVTLILGRAIAGIGAGGVFSGALTIIAHSAPLAKRPVLQSSIGAVFGVASVLGPLLGGVLTENASWRWCFWINLPIGLVTATILILKLNVISEPSSPKSCYQHILELDPIGTILFIPSITCLLLALQLGSTTYAWSSPRIIALLSLFAVLLIAFVAVQIYLGDGATVPPRIISQRTIAAISFFAFCLAGVRYMLLYMLPIWFQAVLGFTAVRSGIATIPLVLSHAISILIVGRLIMSFGYYLPWVYLSVILTSVGSGLIYTLSPTSKAAAYIGYQVIYGLGTGCAFQIPQISAQVVLQRVSSQARTDIPIGIAITLFFQFLGSAVLLGVGSNVLDITLVHELTSKITAPDFDATQVLKLGATQLRQFVPVADLSQALDAYNTALSKAFLVAVIVSCVGVFGAAAMEWERTQPSRSSQPSTKQTETAERSEKP